MAGVNVKCPGVFVEVLKDRQMLMELDNVEHRFILVDLHREYEDGTVEGRSARNHM